LPDAFARDDAELLHANSKAWILNIVRREIRIMRSKGFPFTSASRHNPSREEWSEVGAKVIAREHAGLEIEFQMVALERLLRAAKLNISVGDDVVGRLAEGYLVSRQLHVVIAHDNSTLVGKPSSSDCTISLSPVRPSITIVPLEFCGCSGAVSGIACSAGHGRFRRFRRLRRWRGWLAFGRSKGICC
jgi:hypothetical protein